MALLLTNSFESAAGALGVWLAGGCIVSLPVIARGMDVEIYRRLLKRILERTGAQLMVADGETAGLLQGLDVGADVAAFGDLDASPRRGLDPADQDTPAFIQYSSGSTSDPRGCVLTPRAIAWQLQALARHLDIDPDRDTGAVWVPLSHDMGFFGCLLLTYWTDHPLALGTPERFLRNPASWMDDCSAFNATVTAGPPFAVELAARGAGRLRRRPPLRRLVIGGDRVDAGTIERAVASGMVSAPTLMPAYGLAEATLAVSAAALGCGATVLAIDRDSLETAGRVAPADAASTTTATHLVAAGAPLGGVDVSIDAAEPHQVGEILISSLSQMDRYQEEPPGKAQTEVAMGAVRTGDLGFVLAGQLYVIGRTDDMFVVGGRNVYARDIETALQQVAGVRPGACAVVPAAAAGRNRLTVVVELEAGTAASKVLAHDLAAAAMAAAGVALGGVVVLARGSLPKTPSGKLQRSRCRSIAAAAPESAEVIDLRHT